MKINKINSNKFTWENSGIRNSYCITDFIKYNTILNKFEYQNQNIYIPMGWCFGKDIAVRPREDSICLMFYDVECDSSVWIHFDKTTALIHKDEIGLINI